MYSFFNRNRKFFLIIIDICIAIFTYFIPYVINCMFLGKFSYSTLGLFLNQFWIYTLIYILIFIIMGVYKKVWRYAGIEDIFLCLKASLIANSLFLIITQLLGLSIKYYVYLIVFLVSSFLSVTIRILYRFYVIEKNKHYWYRKNYVNVLIIGAGEATVAILNEMKSNNPKNYLVKCILDDDEGKIGRKINSVLVEGNTSIIESVCEKYNIEEIILSIPSIDKDNKKRILDECAKTKCKLKILPEIYSLLNDDKTNNFLNKVRDVQVEDLLGRNTIDLNNELAKEYIKDKIILVTGGGGSIGSELCRQIALYSPKKLMILDIYENNAYEIEQELMRKYHGELCMEIQIASIRDYNKLNQIFSSENIDIVFHAAAHKHVPLMENNPEEAIKNNVLGTYNVAKVAYENNVKKFILISTDKAVNPTSIMGATKRIAEMIIQTFDNQANTEYVAVRFGNVLGSNGSVIPLFINQIKERGPVTITHEDITRYFMTITEAVQLVLKAGSMAKGGEIFVLDMGEPVKIKDLAYNLIRLSGLEPNVDIDIIYTGLRPGEKLYEELLISDNKCQIKTGIDKIFIEKPTEIDEIELSKAIKELEKAAFNMDYEKEIEIICRLVPSYSCS